MMVYREGEYVKIRIYTKIGDKEIFVAETEQPKIVFKPEEKRESR